MTNLPGTNAANRHVNLDLHIGELVLHGFEHLDRAGLHMAVQATLSQLLAQRDLPASFKQSGHIDGLAGGTFTARQGASAGEIGAQIAQNIYRSFGS